MKRVGILSTSLILFVICLFSFSVNAFAFNNKYITDSGSWYKNGNLININNDVLSGQLCYILDENEKFLTPVITQAEYYSQIFGRQGIHVGEDMDATKGKMRQDSFGIGGDSSGMHLHRMNCCFVISSETKCFRI